MESRKANSKIDKVTRVEVEEEKKLNVAPKTSMHLRSDNFDLPMLFERTVNLLVYYAAKDMKAYSFEVRTNAKLVNPITGEKNLHIDVKEKKKSDGINTQLSRPDCELEDSDNGIWIVIDAKYYNSKNTPHTDEMLKDIKCRHRKKAHYTPTVGLMICSK